MANRKKQTQENEFGIGSFGSLGNVESNFGSGSALLGSMDNTAADGSGMSIGPLADAFTGSKTNAGAARGIGSLLEDKQVPAAIPKQTSKKPRTQRKKSKTLSVSRIRVTSIKEGDVAYPKGAVYQDVIVPSTEYDKPVSAAQFRKRQNEIKMFFSNTFGGYTAVEIVGGWVSNGKIIKEKGAKIVSFSSKSSWTKKNQRDVIRFLRQKCKEWKQEALSYRIEDDLYFLKPAR